MMFLDVVYNHFGPDGNYLSAYAPQFFRDDIATPWGAAIDFRRPEVRRYFTENALYWLHEYRFDGLRFDAVHAISEADWLDEMAAEVRRSVEPGRHVHLVLEHDGNVADHLRRDFDAQWNDDAHHVLHAMLTGESDGYYADYADAAGAAAWRARWPRASSTRAIPRPIARARRAARPATICRRPPSCCSSRTTTRSATGRSATASPTRSMRTCSRPRSRLQLLCPHVPMIFMGEEDATTSPFLYFTDHTGDLANAVREGRRREFAGFKGFAPGEGTSTIPDPNEPATFEQSRAGAGCQAGYGAASSLPRASGHSPAGAHAQARRARIARALRAVEPSIGRGARWRLGDGATLVACDQSRHASPRGSRALQGDLLFESRPEQQTTHAAAGSPARPRWRSWCRAVSDEDIRRARPRSRSCRDLDRCAGHRPTGFDRVPSPDPRRPRPPHGDIRGHGGEAVRKARSPKHLAAPRHDAGRQPPRAAGSHARARARDKLTYEDGSVATLRFSMRGERLVGPALDRVGYHRLEFGDRHADGRGRPATLP